MKKCNCLSLMHIPHPNNIHSRETYQVQNLEYNKQTSYLRHDFFNNSCETHASEFSRMMYDLQYLEIK